MLNIFYLQRVVNSEKYPRRRVSILFRNWLKRNTKDQRIMYQRKKYLLVCQQRIDIGRARGNAKGNRGQDFHVREEHFSVTEFIFRS